MKDAKKDSEVVWDQIQMRSSSANPIVFGQPVSTQSIPKLMVWLILFVSITYVIYTVKLLAASVHRTSGDFRSTLSLQRLSLTPSILNETAESTSPNHRLRDVREKPVSVVVQMQAPDQPKPTEIHDIVFGIADSSKLWQQRKEYIKIWYKPNKMRGIVWLDDHVEYSPDDERALLPVRVSNDTSNFDYTN